MLVDAQTLAVRPIADRVLEAAAGEIVSDVERGETAWSNELVLHVLEMKTNGPAALLGPLTSAFQRQVHEANEMLAAMGARLMPTAMHPWIDPSREMRLWPHEYNPVYEAFNRIFDCRGHGWANLQSAHLNLPFSGDDEFGRLHAAIRLLLPILPALAASSPIKDGRVTGLVDSRLDVYRSNSRSVPSIAGRVVPEPVFTRAEYEHNILAPIYRDIRPHDPEGVLQHEWLNARGAIARFTRGAIEIRVLDVQECPAADTAICAAIVGILKALIAERFADRAAQRRADTRMLEQILLATIRDGEKATIDQTEYLDLFGAAAAGPCTAGHLLRKLVEAAELEASWLPALSVILDRGPLARRILGALGDDHSRDRQAAVYRGLCDCLATGHMFLP
jgi:gamma-glutamyl:cysteine ligase YbdK (ATP-grasp superfamily)